MADENGIEMVRYRVETTLVAAADSPATAADIACATFDMPGPRQWRVTAVEWDGGTSEVFDVCESCARPILCGDYEEEFVGDGEGHYMHSRCIPADQLIPAPDVPPPPSLKIDPDDLPEKGEPVTYYRESLVIEVASRLLGWAGAAPPVSGEVGPDFARAVDDAIRLIDAAQAHPRVVDDVGSHNIVRGRTTGGIA